MKKSYIQPSIVTILAVGGGKYFLVVLMWKIKKPILQNSIPRKTISSPSWMMNLRTVGLKPLPFGISK